MFTRWVNRALESATKAVSEPEKKADNTKKKTE
jgi:hypothetical protein